VRAGCRREPSGRLRLAGGGACGCIALLPWALAAAGQPSRDAPLPRVVVRGGRFVQRDANQPFAPLGFNYIRLRPKWHGTFAPQRYDARRAEAMLADLRRGGFNVVRVFIDPDAKEGIVAGPSAEGLSAAYLGHFLDFLGRARHHGVYVVPSLLALPACKPYNRIVGRDRARFGHGNEMYFDERFIRAKARYCADFAAAIKAQDPDLLSAVFAYELDNETHFFAHGQPFSPATGTYEWGGRKYDRSSNDDLQRLADEAVVGWADACADAVRTVDPDAMVSVNVFTFRAVGRSGPGALIGAKTKDRRFPARPLALARTKLSYLDIHFYPFAKDTLDRDLASIEFEQLAQACKQAGKPLIMGEFGAFKKPYPTLAEAAAAMKHHLQRVRSLGFVGFLYWTYDTDEQPLLWNAREGKGEILDALRAAARSGQW
jgi:hypothetical protein